MHKAGYQGIEVWGGQPHAYRHDLDDEIGSKRLGILLDTGHANVNGEDLAAAVRSLKDVYRIFVSGELGFGYTLDADTAIVKTYDALSELFA